MDNPDDSQEGRVPLCQSLEPMELQVGESSWFHVAKAAKKLTARPRTSSSEVGASHSVLTPTLWPPARAFSVSSALSSERERKKKIKLILRVSLGIL